MTDTQPDGDRPARLGPAQVAALRPGGDVARLARFLAVLPPEVRPEVLGALASPAARPARRLGVQPPGTYLPRVPADLTFEPPALQAWWAAIASGHA